jgi:hypothetical protein
MFASGKPVSPMMWFFSLQRVLKLNGRSAWLLEQLGSPRIQLCKLMNIGADGIESSMRLASFSPAFSRCAAIPTEARIGT